MLMIFRSTTKTAFSFARCGLDCWSARGAKRGGVVIHDPIFSTADLFDGQTALKDKELEKMKEILEKGCHGPGTQIDFETCG
jgi:hypothetical protein